MENNAYESIYNSALSIYEGIIASIPDGMELTSDLLASAVIELGIHPELSYETHKSSIERLEDGVKMGEEMFENILNVAQTAENEDDAADYVSEEYKMRFLNSLPESEDDRKSRLLLLFQSMKHRSGEEWDVKPYIELTSEQILDAFIDWAKESDISKGLQGGFESLWDVRSAENGETRCSLSAHDRAWIAAICAYYTSPPQEIMQSTEVTIGEKTGLISRMIQYIEENPFAKRITGFITTVVSGASLALIFTKGVELLANASVAFGDLLTAVGFGETISELFGITLAGMGLSFIWVALAAVATAGIFAGLYYLFEKNVQNTEDADQYEQVADVFDSSYVADVFGPCNSEDVDYIEI